MVALFQRTSVSVPIVGDNLHVDVSAQVGQMTSNENSRQQQQLTADFYSRFDVSDNNVRQKCFKSFEKRNIRSSGWPRCNAECLFKYNFMDMMSGSQVECFFSSCISTKLARAISSSRHCLMLHPSLVL